MSPSSLSTSSSETPSRGLRELLVVIAATACALALMDGAINAFLSMPSDPHDEPSKLQRYFDYGRSTEGKIRYLVRETDAASGPIATAGWLTVPEGLPAKAALPGGRLFAVYGQSMSHRVADAIAAQDNSVTLRKLGAPGAPLGHSFEYFRRDRGKHQADVVLLGVVASGLRALTSMTTMGWAFEVPAPYTYPRWVLVNGQLTAIQPSIQTLADLRRALHAPAQWREFVDQLRTHDVSYSSMIFDAGVSDVSATLRAAKRGLGQRHQDTISNRYHGEKGFLDTDGILSVTRAILAQFAADVRADGAIPVVLLFHDRGYGDDLYRAVSQVLAENKIPFISTHAIAPAGEASSFLPDGHFRREFDVKIARQVLALAR